MPSVDYVSCRNTVYLMSWLTCLDSFELLSMVKLLAGIIEWVMAWEGWGLLLALFSERFHFPAWVHLTFSGTVFEESMLASYNQFENSGNVNIVDDLALTSPFEMSSSNALFASVALSVTFWPYPYFFSYRPIYLHTLIRDSWYLGLHYCSLWLPWCRPHPSPWYPSPRRSWTPDYAFPYAFLALYFSSLY